MAHLWYRIKFWLTKRTDYNLFADEWNDKRQQPWPEFEVLQKMLESIISDGKQLLDVGCGNGRLCSQLSNDWEYNGCDVSAQLIEIAAKQYPNADLTVAQATKLPHPSFAYDVITSIAVLSHLPTKRSRRQAVQEMLRVLKPGGQLFLTVWNLDQARFADAHDDAIGRSAWWPWWSEDDYVVPFGPTKLPRMYHRFSEQELMNLLQQAGFIDIQIDIQEKNIIATARKPEQINILSVPLDCINKEQALNQLHQFSTGEQQTFVATPNPEICVAATRDHKFREVLQSTDLSVADGWGLLWAADFATRRGNALYLPGQPRGTAPAKIRALFSIISFFFRRRSNLLPERVTGSDLFRSFCETTTQKVFLLGSTPDVTQRCQEIFGEQVIVSHDNGLATDADAQRIIGKVNKSKADVLFVAFGAPKQELWIHKYLEKMPNIKLAVGVGGSFDFVAGKQVRAPHAMQKLGLEWLWRLIREPKRWKRIWTAVVVFPWLVAKRS